MAKDIFKPALRQLAGKSQGLFGPISFQDYLKEHGLPASGTAESISIDSYERLPNDLKDNDTMILRLGESLKGTGTQFCLVKSKGCLSDFFLIDNDAFSDKEGSTFLPSASIRQLFAYQLLPALSESSFVNLGLASGLISFALGLSDQGEIAAPATGRSAFSFKLKAHTSLPDELEHRNGQVEIDALFVGTRNGKEALFIVEAKSNVSDKSLAKHKLVYPIFAVAKSVPKDMPIVPVYMKIVEAPDGLHYHVVECEFPDPRKERRALNELTAKAHTHLILPNVMFGSAAGAKRF